MKQEQDRDILLGQEYVDDRHLDVRYRTHQLYTVDPVDFGRWTLEQLPWQGHERVLDIGCGPGDLIRQMGLEHAGWGLLAGLDFSPGMIAKAVARVDGQAIVYLVGDAQTLPFPGGSFDVAMARHMLYHVPDIPQAIAKAARVLRPGGQFLTTTNSAYTMPEYEDLRRRAARRFPVLSQPELTTERFSLENAESFLGRFFERVESHILRGTLRFPAAEPLVDYFASSRAMIMNPDHTDAEWQAVLAFVRAEVEKVIARQGHFDVTKITGAVVGVKGDAG